MLSYHFLGNVWQSRLDNLKVLYIISKPVRIYIKMHISDPNVILKYSIFTVCIISNLAIISIGITYS